MVHDIPAEFLPSLPASRPRQPSVVADARLEAMRSHMQQRPNSMRQQDSNRMSMDNGRPLSMDQSARMRSESRDERQSSMRIRPESLLREPNETMMMAGARSSSRNSLPIAMAQLEAANPQFANLAAGNRDTLSLTDAQLASKLQTQLSRTNAPASDGDVVSAEIVHQEVLDRREALQVLDAEIAALEVELLNAEEDNENGRYLEHQLQSKLDYMRPQSHRPYFSIFIFCLTLAALLAEIGVNGGVENFSVNPTLGPKSEVLLLMGAKETNLIVHRGEWWRLFVPVILHAGIIHFLINMIGLWNIGVSMEREFGTWKIALIYLGSGFFGVLVSCLFAPNLISVGASGAIFGLFGAAWADLIQNWSLYRGTQFSMLMQLSFMTVLNIMLGLMPFLDNFAHLGGLVCGLVLGLLLLVQTRYLYTGQRKQKRVYQLLLMACSFLVFPALFIAGYLVLFLRVPIDCDWCSFLSCVPMPPDAPREQRWWNCD